MPRSILFLVAALLACANASAQTATAMHHGPSVEAAYRELPPPPLMQGIGNASLKITTNSAAAQAYFNQGLRLLHCFWDFEAYRAFKEVARQDPSAAMAYWGEFEALKLRGPVKEEGIAALEKAKSLADKASEHEQFYIRAAEHEVNGEKPEERTAYQREMEALVDRYPDDLDAQAFLGLGLMGGYESEGRPREGELYSQAVLHNLLTAHPDNTAANHYWIHTLETSSHPEDALPSADMLASLAPSSGHLVHMPGHIYWRVGDYEKARQSFLASLRVDEAYMAAQGIKPEEDWNYFHNLAYLIAACGESGRYREGLEWAKKLRDVSAPAGMNSATFVTWAGSSLVRVHFRFGDWQAVSNDPVSYGAEPGSAGAAAKAYSDGLNFYSKGMAALEKADLAEAATQSENLDASLWRLEAAKPKKKDDAAAQDDQGEDPTEILNLLGTLSLDLRGNLKVAQGDTAGGMSLLQRAVEKQGTLSYTEPPHYYRPEQESLGYAYLRTRQWEKARDAFNEALRERPKSGLLLYGIAQSYAMPGDVPHTTSAYRDFLTAWQNADSDLPQVQQAKAWLASHPR